VRWSLDLRALRTAEDNGSISLYEGSGNDFSAIKEVYEKYSDNLNMAVVRSDVKYKQFRQKNPSRDGYYTYLYRNGNGEPAGVMAFTKKHENSGAVMDCDCFWFTDKNALLCLLNFAKGFQPYYHQIRFTLPVHIDMHNLVAEWCIYNSSISPYHLGMGRAVHVQTVLETARYRGAGKIILRITDPVIKQNEGVYLIEYANGKAVSVIRDDNAAPDATLTVNTFSVLILGGGESSDTVNFSDWRDGMTVHSPDAPFKDIFYQKPLFIMDSF
jgi:predicted acetyltransferase